MKNKNTIKKVISVLSIVMLLFVVIAPTVDARISTDANGSDGTSTFDVLVKIVDHLGTFIGSAAFAGLASVVTLLGLVLFMLMRELFMVSGIVSSWSSFPMPDTILFNRVAFLDPNFLNPAKNALVSSFSNVIKNTFESFRIIAIAIFIVAAMIIGIKLAVSSLAAEKAKYKQAIMYWITGIIILTVLKYIISAIFIINEEIVEIAFRTQDSIAFQVPTAEAIPVIGTFIKSIRELFTNKEYLTVSVPGYLGFFLRYLLQGLGGNLLSSIIAFIVMGQTITLLIAYIKRMVLCVMLAVASPLIVAVDTINKSVGKQGNLFNNWFKNFTLTVMMQSFHAMVLVVILKILSSVEANSVRESLIAIIMTTGLVKFEKMFKKLFGIDDGMMGDLKGAAMKSIAAIHGAKQAVGAVGDNIGKYKNASKKRASLVKERDLLVRENKAKSVLESNFGTAKGVPANTDPSTLEGLKNQKYAAAMQAKANGDMNAEAASSTQIKMQAAKDELAAIKREKRELEIKSKETEIGQETANMSSAAFASAMGPANLIAGAGFGIGLGQDVADAFVKGGYITKGLDAAAERIGRRGADRERSRQYDEAKENGRENPDILRKTVNVAQTVTNNIVPNAKEIADILSGSWSESSHRTPSTGRVYKPAKDVDDI